MLQEAENTKLRLNLGSEHWGGDGEVEQEDAQSC